MNLTELKEKARLGGGSKSIAKQHQSGKLTARERVSALLDPGSFMEMDMFRTHHCHDFGMDNKKYWGDGVVVGSGFIEGRLVYVTSQDFTVLGGSLGESHALKISKAMDMAIQNAAPIIQMVDTGGARIQEGPAYYGMILNRNTLASGIVPQICAVLGPCSGGASISAAISDFVFMVDGISVLFSSGPKVLEKISGEEISANDLGGARVHSEKSGVANFFTKAEAECFKLIRELMGYLPSNSNELPPRKEFSQDLHHEADIDWSEVIPDSNLHPYDMKRVIRSLVDHRLFLEIQENYAKNVIIGFARLNGETVGVIGNQPIELSGFIDMNASDKCARFIRFCDSFNIPLVNFVDSPGYFPGKEQEHLGAVRHMAKMAFAYSEATVPRIVVVTGKVYGGAISGMGVSKMLGTDLTVALPSAEIAVMGPDAAVHVLYSKEISKIKDKDEREIFKQQKIHEYKALFANPFKAAEKGWIDDIIAPSEMRSFLVSSLQRLRNKKVLRPRKKHGLIPL
jgi:acetyl-CoA carboxylase carboxyltransferase component